MSDAPRPHRAQADSARLQVASHGVGGNGHGARRSARGNLAGVKIMRVYLQAQYRDGVERLGSDHGAVRSDLRTERGARRWALAWLESRPSWNALGRAVAVRVSLVSDGRPYGEAFKAFTVRTESAPEAAR